MKAIHSSIKGMRHVYASMVIIVASVVRTPATRKGAAPTLKVASAPLPVADAVEPEPERDAVLPEPEPDEPPEVPVDLAVVAADEEVTTAVSVAAAAKSWLDAYVWQLDEATCVGVYGGTIGPVWGWNHVVTWPLVVKTPGGSMSSESQTVNVPLMAL